MGQPRQDTPNTRIGTLWRDRRHTLTLSLWFALVAVLLYPQEPRLQPKSLGRSAEIYWPDGEILDFGEVDRGRFLKARIRFLNKGLRSLVLHQIQTKCDCIFVDLPIKRTYSRGESGEIAIRIDTSGLGGSVEKTFSVMTNDPKRPTVEIFVRGRVRVPPAPRLECVPQDLPVRLLGVDESGTFQFSIVNSGVKPLEFKIQAKDVTLETRVGRLRPQARQVIRGVISAPKFQSSSSGLIERTLSIESNDPENSRLGYSLRFYCKGLKKFGLSRDRWGIQSLRPEQGIDLFCFNDSDKSIELSVAKLPKELSLSRLPLSVPAGGAVSFRATLKFPGDVPKLYKKACVFLLNGESVELQISNQESVSKNRKIWVQGLDIGEVRAGEKTQFKLRIGNESSRSIEMTRALSYSTLSDENWAFQSNDSGVIKPGELIELKGEHLAGHRLGGSFADLRLSFKSLSDQVFKLSSWVVAPKASHSVSIFYESDMRGEIEPCGCGGVEQLGGLARLATVVSRTPSDRRLFLSAGNIAGGDTAVYRRRQQLAYRELKAMGLDAFVPGYSDFEVGQKAFLQSLQQAKLTAVCANWNGPNSWVIPYKSLTRNGLKIAVTGVFAPERMVRQSLRRSYGLLPMRSSLQTVSAAIEPDTDIRILLAQADHGQALQLAADFGFDLVICGGVSYRIEKPAKSSNVVALACPDSGRRVGELVSSWVGGKLKAWSHSFHDLGSNVTANTQVNASILQYRKSLKTLPVALVKPGPRDRQYAGWISCRKCHEDIDSHWQSTRHSVAMASLKSKFNHFDPACTQCHTVGQGKPYGFQRLDLTPKLAEVQCESCHGPAQDHASNPSIQPMPTNLLDCLQCHNGKHSPGFDPADYWRQIAHGKKSLLKLWDKDKNGQYSDSERKSLENYRRKMKNLELLRREKAKQHASSAGTGH